MRIALIILLILSLVACNQSDDSFAPNSEMEGAWILYEEGFSPGSGYVINPVPQEPPQTIFFSGGKHFGSTLQFLVGYKFYELNKDVQSDTWELRLYKVEPDPLKEPEASRLIYNFSFEGDRIKLSPRFPSVCIEGCHMGFKRYTDSR